MKIKFVGMTAILALACIVSAFPVSASLVATSFGFPVIIQNGSTTAFNQYTAFAQDLEDVSISFPTGTEGTDSFGAVNLAFPTISQTVNKVQATTSTSFSQTNEFAEFAYPFTSVGGSALTSLASLGFSF
jgi:hypothetical protein